MIALRRTSRRWPDASYRRPSPSLGRISRTRPWRPFSSDAPSRTLHMYNSLTGEIEPMPNSPVCFYVCGPTVYAPAHLGHARTYVWMDIIRRVWQSTGGQPIFVMNITDVDDKILDAAKQKSTTPSEVARFYEQEFWKDLNALNCQRPNVVTRVTDHVEASILPYIEKLLDHEMAYIQEGDGVYFDVCRYEHAMKKYNSTYGKLAPSTRTDSLDGSDHDNKFAAKRDRRDFALWKNRKPEEELFWLSPWGEGRPGWHIECSAMIESVESSLGIPFAVHAGGVDLKFPHHTNEIAQAEAYHQKGHWIDHWVHTGHLYIDGLKMSKSLKNFITIESIFAGNDDDSILTSPADDFRFWCLSGSSYRGPATYSLERLAQARSIRQGIVEFIVDAELWLENRDSTISTPWTETDRQLFQSSIEESGKAINYLLADLDTAAFVECVCRLAKLGSRRLLEGKTSKMPKEPIELALNKLRDMLLLVGMSKTTTHPSQVSTNTGKSLVVGGEMSLLDELSAFRARVRGAAIAGLKNPDHAIASLKELLEDCDNLRDQTLPAMGVELADEKFSHSQDFETKGSLWNLCAPSTVSDAPLEGDARARDFSADLSSIPLQDLFRVGQYEGQFAAFDELGLPTQNTDGSSVSKRMRKKLEKKREKHASRIGAEA